MAPTRKVSSKSKDKPDQQAWPNGDSFGLTEDGGWADVLRETMASATSEAQPRWHELIVKCREVQPRSGRLWQDVENETESKCGHPPLDYPDEEPKPDPGSQDYQQTLAIAAPDEDWLGRVRNLIETGNLHSDLARILSRATQSGIGTLNRNCPKKEILRTLIWCAATSSHAQCIDSLRQLASWSVEHKTAQAKTIGIALAFMNSELAASALRMIAEAAKRPSPKTRFNRYASHVEIKIGLSAQDSAERFIPTFELSATGLRRIDCGEDGAIELRIIGSDATSVFFSSSGKVVNTAPAALKRNHAESLAAIRDSAKALGKLLATQRSRLESLLLGRTEWEFRTWQERYLNHPVVGALARRLIWTLDGHPVIFQDGQPMYVHGQIAAPKPESRVRLWHPIEHSANDVLAWRNQFDSLEITQPFKQAHREVYVLTDAERRTNTYSNRFAAHILNQSQFRALALTRGWERPFIGGWDGGKPVASRMLPDGWRVEFWLEGAGAEHGPTGGSLYVATDQVRFYRGDIAEPAPLDQVSRLIFSEAMRDVDLFVGVASVGNDPTWNDGGPAGRYRDYWQNYSFGELNASAKTRKEVLERLLPRLKISEQCSFDEKFLLVQGRLRTYKIHLGSGNILMEPNGQYLCIVPKPSGAQDDVLLPFEGDRTLSVILSKAFLLAADDMISDETISRQIQLK